MKNIVAVGNCQMFPIVNCLRSIQEVNEVYSIFHARPVHVISKENLFEVYQKCSECDILICNFVNKGYRNNIGIDTPHLISLTPQNAKIILLPSIHWEGQNPELFYLKKEDGSVCTESFDYHNKIIFFSYLQGFSIEKTTEYLLEGENVFLDKIFLEIANKNLFLRENNLRERERERESHIINISDIIAQNYIASRLFWTFNHPTNVLLNKINQKIISHIIDCKVVISSENELLNNSFFPIHESVYKSLDFQFENKKIFRIRNTFYSAYEIVKLYFDFYAQNKKIVEYNKKLPSMHNFDIVFS